MQLGSVPVVSLQGDGQLGCCSAAWPGFNIISTSLPVSSTLHPFTSQLTPPSFPCCSVEMKPAAVKILEQRAAASGLANVTTFLGMIEQFAAPFDVGLALHACGNATDYMLLRSQQLRAAFVVSPCCVGELGQCTRLQLLQGCTVTCC